MTQGQSDALGITLRVLASVVRGGSPERAAAVLPWMQFLSDDDRAACLEELGRIASAAVSTGRLGHLAEALDQWRATGLAAWDERRLRERNDPTAAPDDEPLELTRPSP